MKRLLAVLILTGCAANAQTPPPRVDYAAVHRHPLYGTLAQYDRQIAALRSTLNAQPLSHAGADIARATDTMRGDLDAASRSINTLVSQHADEFAAHQDAAVSALLANGNAPAPSQADVRSHLEQQYRSEYAALRNGADQDMAHYRDTLLAQQNAAYHTYVASVQRHTQDAYSARAQELRERESTLLLELARRDSAQRLDLRAKLQTLYLRPEQRKQYQARLQALQEREDRAVTALRASDAKVLASYGHTLIAKADSDVAHMSAQLQARTEANLAARRDVLVAQHAAPASLPLAHSGNATPSASHTADLRSQVSELRQNGRKQFLDDAAAVTRSYAAVRDDLTRRFSALRGQDAASIRDTKAQIAQLQRDRQELYDQIVRDITSPARK